MKHYCRHCEYRGEIFVMGILGEHCHCEFNIGENQNPPNNVDVWETLMEASESCANFLL